MTSHSKIQTGETQETGKIYIELNKTQKGILYDCLTADNTALYLTQVLITFKEEINREELVSAWMKIISKYDALRLVLSDNDKFELLEKVDFEIEDYDFCSENFPELLFEQLKKQSLNNTLDLYKAPLMKLFLVKLKEHHYVLIWVHHHIILDATSITRILKDFFFIYDEGGSNVNTRQQQRIVCTINEETPKVAETYWTEIMQNCPIPSYVVSLGQRNKRTSEPARSYEFIFSNDMINRLRYQASIHNLTLNSILQAAWGLTLMRYLGVNDVFWGEVRSFPKTLTADKCGLFINTLPLRGHYMGHRTLDFIYNIRDQQKEFKNYYNISLNQINEDINLAIKSPLFDTVLDFKMRSLTQGVFEDDRNKDGRKVCLSVDTGYPMLLEIVDEGNQVWAKLNYVVSIFDLNFIQEWTNNYLSILETLSNSMMDFVAEVVRLNTSEKMKVFAIGNQTKRTLKKKQYLHELVDASILQYPEKCAISSARGNLTYKQLDNQANRIAHCLRAQKIQPNNLVAVVMEKGWEEVVATLAILRSGAAYLPISAGFPDERIQQLLEQGDVNYILTQNHLLEKIKWPAFVKCFDVNDEEFWQDYPEERLKNIQQLTDLAYVIFTSGSTGKPKGVMIDHLGVVNTIQDINTRFNISCNDVIFGLSALNFDLSVYDIFGCLAAGGHLVFPADEDKKDPAIWLSWILRYGVTVWNSVPALMQMLIEYLESDSTLITERSQLRKLKLVLLSGDWLPISLPMRVQNIFGSTTAVISLGGATEASIWSILYPIEKVDTTWSSIPYGQPMWNQKFYILDKDMYPVPKGAIGELYIGGIGVAKGYWKDPGRTKMSFIDHPDLGTIYRTGDLGKYLTDENIEFLGRKDYQVKLRGYRIELGEIEAVVSTLSSIEEAIVLLHEVDQKNQYLVCYFIASKEIESADMKNMVRTKLPDYMVPGFFIQLDKFPLSANGKTDRKLLPAPNFKIHDGPVSAANTLLEKKLLKIWIEVFGNVNIGITDNFFEVGGHSLRAIQVISRVKKILGYELSIRKLFEYPDVRSLTKYLETQLACTDEVNTLKRSENIVYPLSSEQSRILFLSKMVLDIPFYNITLAYKINHTLNEEALKNAFVNAIQKNSILRNSFYQDEQGFWQKTIPIAELSLNVDCRITYSETEINELIHQESLYKFDLSSAPLIKLMLVSSKKSDILVITVHHIIFDEWSIKLLMTDLSHFYNKNDDGVVGAPLNHAPNLQYQDYVFWKNNKHDSVADLEYWKNELSGEIPYINLAIMKPRSQFQTFLGETKHFTVSDGLKDKLSRFCKDQNITKFSFLLAIFKVLLYKYSNQNDLLIGIPVSQRNQSEFENIIGCFINTLVIRTKIEDGISFVDLCKKIQNKTLSAMQHQELSYEKLIDALGNIDRSTDRNALFQIMFSYNILDTKDYCFDNVQVIALPVSYSTAKFDLTLFVFEDNSKIERMAFEYNVNLFEPEVIEQLTNHYLNLLDSILKNPLQVIEHLSMIGENEKNFIRYGLNATDKNLGVPTYLHKLVDYGISTFPEKTAVISARGSITYRNLHEHANKIAHCLREYGVKPNELVAIIMEKGWEEVVGCLAILRAGAAFLPISAGFPMQRVWQLLELGVVHCVLTQKELISKLHWPNNLNIFAVDDKTIWDKYPSSDLDTLQTLTDLAYVIFTSGSTGSPKGVMIDHRGAVNTIKSINMQFNTCGDDNVLGLSSLNFDLSVYDIFGSLAVGATLILPDEMSKKDPSTWLKLCVAHKISIWNSVPTLMQMFVEYVKNIQIDASYFNLRLVLLSGDWLPISLPNQLTQTFGETISINSLGGATEASIWSVMYPIQSVDFKWHSIPYGKPMWNQKMFILDHLGTHVPLGMVGDIYIGGIGLAKGYWRDEEKTQNSFIHHPELGRIYKTGDLGRYLHDGNIEFLGRVDHQVKIRGHRIELGEVETVILSFASVERVLVTTSGQDENKQLVAYLTGVKESQLKVLEAYVESKLPGYMIPTAFTFLKEMPLSDNGKIDIKALPKVNFKNNRDKRYYAPETEIQQKLSRIWSKLLGCENVSLYDNFFHLGGHSLLAIQMLVEIKNLFFIDFPLKEIFQASHLFKLSDRVELLVNEKLKDADTFYYI